MSYAVIWQKVFDLLSWKSTTQSILDSLIDRIYPVGTIYMSMNDVSPATFLGGTWEKLEDGRVLIAANSTYAVNSIGGSETHTLVTSELPSHTHTIESAGAHTHTRGTMNITSRLVNHWRDYSNGKSLTPINGAFYVDSNSYPKSSYPNVASANSGSYYNDQTITFDASRSWTGSTSSDGAHTHTVNATGSGSAHNNMQPYRACYMWKRTA